MARTLPTVMAAAALLCLVRSDPTPEIITTTTTTAAPQSSAPTPTTSTGPQTFNLENIVGKWWSYRENSEGDLNAFDIDVVKKTPAEIALLKEQFRSQDLMHLQADISWDNISLCYEYHIDGYNVTIIWLVEALTDPSYVKLINLRGPVNVDVTKIKLSDDKLTLRLVNSFFSEFNFYRTPPDLATFARCQGFDDFDASEAVDADFLVGTWTPSGHNCTRCLFEHYYSLIVSKKTTQEVAVYRQDLRNTTIGEADIDWTKVQVEVELIRGNSSWAHALIEFLDKPGSIRVIPLRDAWDSIAKINGYFVNHDVWFMSQNIIIKKDDGFLAIKNCHNPEKAAYLMRRPESRRKTKIWKTYN